MWFLGDALLWWGFITSVIGDHINVDFLVLRIRLFFLFLTTKAAKYRSNQRSIKFQHKRGEKSLYTRKREPIAHAEKVLPRDCKWVRAGYLKDTFGKPKNKQNEFPFSSLNEKLRLTSVFIRKKKFRPCLFFVKFFLVPCKSGPNSHRCSYRFPRPQRKKRQFHKSSQSFLKSLGCSIVLSRPEFY